MVVVIPSTVSWLTMVPPIGAVITVTVPALRRSRSGSSLP
jgi:hypothetical protein